MENSRQDKTKTKGMRQMCVKCALNASKNISMLNNYSAKETKLIPNQQNKI
jgi:hypothetical protein